MAKNQRALLGIFCAMACIKISAATAPDSQAGATKRPNIVFIMADDLGWMDTSVYGSLYYNTPNIDRLAKQGMRFINAYSTSPLCSPSRAGIITGKYNSRMHIYTAVGHIPELPEGFEMMPKSAAQNLPLVTPTSRRAVPAEEYTFAEALRDAGYHTGFIGKWHMGLEEKFWPRNQGFEFDLGSSQHGPSSYFSPYNYMNPDLPDGPPGEHLTARLSQEAAKYIEQHQKDPFLLCLWYYAVHIPVQSRTDLTEKYRKRNDPRGKQNCPEMGGMIEAMDQGIGQIMAKLDELGLRENTVVIFYSDNGGYSGSVMPETGKVPTDNYPLRGGKGGLYEGGSRVPAIFAWPRKISPGTISKEVISGIDIYPTILDMTGVKPKPAQKLDGESLLPVLTQQHRLQRESIFCYYPYYNAIVPSSPGVYVRKNDWKLICLFGAGPSRKDRYELYNLREDIGETNNVAEQNPERVSELAHLIEGFIRDTKPILPQKNPAYIPPTPGWATSPQAKIKSRPEFLTVSGPRHSKYIETQDVPYLSGPMHLRIRLRSPSGTTVRLFWTNIKDTDFHPSKCSEKKLSKNNDWQEIVLPCTFDSPMKALKLEFESSADRVDIKKISIEKPWGAFLYDLPLKITHQK